MSQQMLSEDLENLPDTAALRILSDPDQQVRGPALTKMLLELHDCIHRNQPLHLLENFEAVVSHAFPDRKHDLSVCPSQIDAVEFLHNAVFTMSLDDQQVMFQIISQNLHDHLSKIPPGAHEGIPTQMVNNSIELAMRACSLQGNDFLTSLASLATMPKLYYVQASCAIQRWVDNPPPEVFLRIMQNPSVLSVAEDLFMRSRATLDYMWASQNDPEEEKVQMLQTLKACGRALFFALNPDNEPQSVPAQAQHATAPLHQNRFAAYLRAVFS